MTKGWHLVLADLNRRGSGWFMFGDLGERRDLNFVQESEILGRGKRVLIVCLRSAGRHSVFRFMRSQCLWDLTGKTDL